MVLANVTRFVEEMIQGKTDHVIIKDGKKPLQMGDTIRIYYNVHTRKSCENCIVGHLNIEYDDLPMNCPHAGVCKYYTNFIGSAKITGVIPVTDNLYRFRFNKIIYPDRHIEVEQEGTHGIRLTKV